MTVFSIFNNLHNYSSLWWFLLSTFIYIFVAYVLIMLLWELLLVLKGRAVLSVNKSD